MTHASLLLPAQQQANSLVLGLFLLTAFGMTVARQVQATLLAFVAQSFLLACSSLVLGLHPLSGHLLALTAVTLVGKVLLIPWLLRSIVPEAVYSRRERSVSRACWLGGIRSPFATRHFPSCSGSSRWRTARFSRESLWLRTSR